jgi:hypothetical protein
VTKISASDVCGEKIFAAREKNEKSIEGGEERGGERDREGGRDGGREGGWRGFH